MQTMLGFAIEALSWWEKTVCFEGYTIVRLEHADWPKTRVDVLG